MSTECQSETTWSALVEIEPRLQEVEEVALLLYQPRVTNWHAWSYVKRLMSRLVGWTGEKDEISSSDDYEVAYSWLLCCWETGRQPKN